MSGFGANKRENQAPTLRRVNSLVLAGPAKPTIQRKTPKTNRKIIQLKTHSETQICRPVAMRQDLTSTTATTTITTTTTELQQPVTQELESDLKPGLSQNTMKIGDRGIKLPPKGFSNMAN